MVTDYQALPGNSEDPQSSPRLLLPPCPRAVRMRPHPLRDEEGVHRRRLLSRNRLSDQPSPGHIDCHRHHLRFPNRDGRGTSCHGNTYAISSLLILFCLFIGSACVRGFIFRVYGETKCPMKDSMS